MLFFSLGKCAEKRLCNHCVISTWLPFSCTFVHGCVTTGCVPKALKSVSFRRWRSSKLQPLTSFTGVFAQMFLFPTKEKQRKSSWWEIWWKRGVFIWQFVNFGVENFLETHLPVKSNLRIQGFQDAFIKQDGWITKIAWISIREEVFKSFIFRCLSSHTPTKRSKEEGEEAKIVNSFGPTDIQCSCILLKIRKLKIGRSFTRWNFSKMLHPKRIYVHMYIYIYTYII